MKEANDWILLESELRHQCLVHEEMKLRISETSIDVAKTYEMCFKTYFNLFGGIGNNLLTATYIEFKRCVI